ncbi:carbamoyltransferase HypF [Edwardsiella ictaluri]|uniref:carbamoyltransferase HypF n=1 Tax=Edwardsiella ictaluri TaxID=67780 RepID=UPI0009C07461|nr:carbamoyltransferase HypF [Edwardsiella ictaluri]ARD39329.1 carbamoyltransferase HypF [Edwardsiella ictaluri]QPW27754.1 carbamoyltransferase HypF [Edwardsiella ictaluri]
MEHNAIALRIKGKVQGVGFRPYVWQIAQTLGLHGEVSNDAGGVWLVVRLPADLDTLIQRLYADCPPLAHIDTIERHPWAETPADGFRIVDSRQGAMDTQIVPDAATCPRCLAEMRDPANRRYGYPFINCTHCGPRFTIIRRMPYDRPFTAMADFPLCPACAREYHDPADRRFHAQPTACALCGPTMWSCGADGADRREGEAAWQAVTRALDAGHIVAVKGLGGFHLACDAENDAAIARLRKRKRRPGKPLALMLPDLSWLARYCCAAPDAGLQALLSSPAAPIVLVPASDAVPAQVAPGLDEVGVMLPGTPLHHLLMAHIGRPLVMTSGNASGQPPALDNAQALADLAGIADLWLLHNRDIVQRADDSLVRYAPEGSEMLRRARGYVPDTIALPAPFSMLPDVAAVGGDLKNTFCLLQRGRALLSQHLGDLGEARIQQQFLQTWQLLLQTYQFSPRAIACDRHPGYHSHRLAQQQADVRGLPLIAVQHHHAHLAACMAEHGITPQDTPLIGLALDGIGYGESGELWGGECLRVDYRGYTRLGGLPAVALPGGDLAARQPWRNLLAQLLCFVPDWPRYPETQRIQAKNWPLLARAIDRELNCPRASSCGRLFDAAAAALDICHEQISFEGEAACRLEAQAWQAWPQETPVTLKIDEQGELAMGDFWRDWLSWQTSVPLRALAFHRAIADGLAALLRYHAEREGCQTLVLSGGVLHNRLLRQLLLARLADYRLLLPERLPAGDGALALGQAIIAAHCLKDAIDPAQASCSAEESVN